jgi:hypothetical protein
MKRHWRISLSMVLAATLSACSPRTVAVRTTASLLSRGSIAFYEEPDPELAREAMASQLKLLEVLLKNDPDNPTLLELAAEGFGGYAFLFIEDEQPDRAREFYLRGRGYGSALLAHHKSLKGIETLPLSDLQQALKSAKPADAAGLFWSAYNWAGWINLSKNSPDAVAGLPKVAAIMRRIQEMSPGYYHGGPNLFLGTYYSALPRMMGGDPVKSKQYFDAAAKEDQNHFLITKVLCAKYYAVAIQNRALFTSLNTEVISSTDATPDVRLANEVAKLKAKHLLEKINELF